MEQAFDWDGVRGVLHRPRAESGDALILTHGAGSNRDAALLVRVAQAFAEAGWLALRYDLPFRVERPHGPPNPKHAARDREGIGRAAAAIRALKPRRLFAGGHSYGGRQAAMWAAEFPGEAAALLLLSYPLHPPAKPDQLRTNYFPELRTPALFVHGTKDSFGTVEELGGAIARIPSPTRLISVERAGHDLLRVGPLLPEIITVLAGLAGE